MKFEYFIARKYLLKGRRHGFVSLIALISVLGVVVGVMALIVVLAVMSGFDRELKSKIVGVQPHVILEQYGGISNVEEARNQIKALNIPEITSIAPFVTGQAIIRSDYGATGVAVKGLDPAYEPLDLFREHLARGNLEFSDLTIEEKPGKTKQMGRGLIGEGLAGKIRVTLGDMVYIISPAFDTDSLGDLKDAVKRAKNAPRS